MKKLTTLALAAGLIVAAAAPASAIDTKVDGQYLFSFARSDYRFDGAAFNAATGAALNKEFAQQRIRLGLTFTASENLAGYVQFQSVDTWGSAHNAIADTGVRQLYIDWMVPSTPVKVRLGKIQTGLPAHAFGQSMMMGPGNARYAETLEQIEMLGKARGSKMGNNLLVQEIEKAGGIDFTKPVLLGYSGLSDALLLKYIEDSRHIWEGNLDEVRYTTVGSVIGTHAGPGAVVVAFFKK